MAWGSSWAWPGARMNATARPSPSAITHALVPYPPRERPRASRSSRAVLVAPPFFFRARRLVVSPDAGAVQNRHPKVDPALLGQLLGQEQQPLPDTQGGRRPAQQPTARVVRERVFDVLRR